MIGLFFTAIKSIFTAIKPIFTAVFKEVVELAIKKLAFMGFTVMHEPSTPISINVAAKPLAILNWINVSKFLDNIQILTSIPTPSIYVSRQIYDLANISSCSTVHPSRAIASQHSPYYRLNPRHTKKRPFASPKVFASTDAAQWLWAPFQLKCVIIYSIKIINM